MCTLVGHADSRALVSRRTYFGMGIVCVCVCVCVCAICALATQQCPDKLPLAKKVQSAACLFSFCVCVFVCLTVCMHAVFWD